MVHVVAGIAGGGPGIAQLGQRPGPEGAEQQQSTRFEHARDFAEHRVEIVTPLQHQAAEHQVEGAVRKRQCISIGAHALKPAQPPRLLSGLLQHARGNVHGHHRRPGVPALEGTRTVARAGAQIEDGARLHLELPEAVEQFAAHPLLQGGGCVVTAAGAIEGLRHGVPVETEDAARIRNVHEADARASAPISASTCASSCAAEKVTRRRAVPAGTVGGRMAATRKPWASRLLLTASARADSPRITGTMVLPGWEFCASPTSKPKAATPARKRRASASAFSRRQDSRSLTRKAARVAAATAGGSAVV